jgi:hypothetical protein
MSDFRWLIEAPGPKYLGVRNLRSFSDFIWTPYHNAALQFRTEEQAEGLRKALRTNATVHKTGLFDFEGTLGPAKAVEHGWMKEPA